MRYIREHISAIIGVIAVISLLAEVAVGVLKSADTLPNRNNVSNNSALEGNANLNTDTDSGELLYSIGLLSDVHINPSPSDASNTNSQNDFKNALKFF